MGLDFLRKIVWGKHDGAAYHRIGAQIGARVAIKLNVAGMVDTVSVKSRIPRIAVLDNSDRPLGYFLLGDHTAAIGSGNHAIQVVEASAKLTTGRRVFKVPDKILEVALTGVNSYRIRYAPEYAGSGAIQVTFEGRRIAHDEVVEVGTGGVLRINFIDQSMRNFPVGVLKLRFTVPETKGRFQVVKVGRDGVPILAHAPETPPPRSGRTVREQPAVAPEETAAALPPVKPARARAVFLPFSIHLPITDVSIRVSGRADPSGSNCSPASETKDNHYYLLSPDRRSLYRIIPGQAMMLDIVQPPKRFLRVYFDPDETNLTLSMRIRSSAGESHETRPFATPDQLRSERLFVRFTHGTSEVYYEVVFGYAGFLAPDAQVKEISDLNGVAL